MIKKIFSGELARGSAVLFIMFNMYNFFNYLFHFITARMLGPAQYGVLAVLMSFVYIFAIPSEAIQTIVSRYTSKLNVKKEFGKMRDILSKVMTRGIYVAAICFAVFAIASVLLSSILKIDYPLLFITGGIFFGIFLVPAARGILQGRKRFRALGANMLTESVTKIIVAVALIGLGFGVYAAITGVLFGLFLSFLISLMMIGEIAKSEKKDAEVGEIYKYGLSVFLMMFVVMLMYSLDIIFAKIFFTSEMAGKYAVASMIGKMIFFGTAPISKTMFPITSQGFDEGKITKKAFIKSVAMVFAVSLVPLLVMFLYPEILIRLLFGKAYLDVAPILFYLGLGLTLLAFTNLFLIYGIAINKTKKAYIFLIFVVIEVGLLSIFHSTINLFSLAFLVSNAIMFIASAIWLAFAKK